MVDLRSDTVTRPTEGMRRAMAAAEVGDDVYGEDPTARALEERVAALLDKEAAVFVPSGTMANQASLKALTQPGQEVIVEAQAHIVWYERAGLADLSGVQIRPIAGDAGSLRPEDVEEAIRAVDLHFPSTSVLCLENTHNRAGGRVVSVERTRALSELAHRRGLRVHLDGARLWNAAVALRVPPSVLAQGADTVGVCFSKGLGAPVGSAVAGDRAIIRRVREVRKLFGGAMRQVGMLAAAGVYALEHHYDRLAEDHRRAKRLAEGLSDLPGIEVDPSSVETNIVLVVRPSQDARHFVEELTARNVRTSCMGPHLVRFVTHLDVDDAGIEEALRAARDVCLTLTAR